MRDFQLPLEQHRLVFAAKCHCPVMHVAVRGALADGKDYAFFHLENSQLGAVVARAAGVPVWAYHFENQNDTESVRGFGSDGTELTNVFWSADKHEDHSGRTTAPLTELAD